ncbi:ribosomal large subunit assembly [Rhizoctonia solani]|uniref:Ribosomal large subunit assembly n=1 Tax=Rhizoctonia solani TaxID=456999 RepID=A0A8H7I9W3_9AGAM|nr:ribosomal large subunit assembly [Rhizoctonia solani]
MDAAEKKRGLGGKVKHVWNRLFDSPSQSRPPISTVFSRPDNPTRPFDSLLAVASPLLSTVSTPGDSHVNLPVVSRAPHRSLRPKSEATSPLPAAPLGPSYRSTPRHPAQAGLTGALRTIRGVPPRFHPSGSGWRADLVCRSGGGTSQLLTHTSVFTELEACGLQISSVHRREYADLAASLEAAIVSISAPARVEVGSDERADRKDIYVRQLSLLIPRSLTLHQSEKAGGRAAVAKQDEEDIIAAYRRIDGLFRQLSADAALSLCHKMDQQHIVSLITLLEALSPSKLAVYDSKLSEGVARRKTTIAYTFAETLKARKALGASFFCTRTSGECRDVAQVIPTIAYQLADYSPSFRSVLVNALEKDRNITSCTMSTQCNRLILEPLLAVKGAIPEGLMVVIDALDECTNPSGAGLILDMLFRAAPNLPIKFFVTSRPEPDIQYRMQSQSDQRRSICVLHEIEESLVQADIELYLREELTGNAVSEAQLKRLAELSGSLFIYAATAIRYIRQMDTTVNQERLKAILDSSPMAWRRHKEIDSLYTTILAAALEGPNLEEYERERMQLLLWTAVCAREPVSLETLASLAGVEVESANVLLQFLYSVLHVSGPDSMVTTLHASFPDFMFEKARSSRFYCNEAEHSQLLSGHCFGIMKNQLRFNICQLKTSFITDSEVQDLEARKANYILPTLSYAAHHWGDHSVAISSDLIRSLDDSWLFLTRFAANPMSRSTPHIYISALPFCHRSSFVYQRYWPRTHQLLSVQGSVVEQSPSRLLATWAMHSEPVALSSYPDGSRLAVGFEDGTIHILNPHSGALVLGPLSGHSSLVRSISFSLDGSVFASGSFDTTIIVWDAYTGARLIGPIEAHNDEILSVCFSSDGHHILSGSMDHTTRIWDSRTGSLVPNSTTRHPHPVLHAAFFPGDRYIACGLESDECPMVILSTSTGEQAPGWHMQQGSPMRVISFSPDGRHAVTGHNSGDILLWSVQDGTIIHELTKVHSNWIRSIVFSPSGNKLLTASLDGTVYAWDPQSDYGDPWLFGRHQKDARSLERTALDSSDHHPWKAPTSPVLSVAVSPDGSRIAAASGDHAIYMFSVYDGAATLEPLAAHTNAVNSIAFSHDGRYIASGGADHAICLWDGRSGKLLSGPLRLHTGAIWSVSFSPITVRDPHTLSLLLDPFGSHTHTGEINSVTFSPNGALIASGSDDGTICVFDSYTGHLVLGPLSAHADLVRSVVFSPDGAHILSGSNDRTVRVWSVKDGAAVCEPMRGHQSLVLSVAYSPDGSHIVSGSLDSTIRMEPYRTTAVGLRISDDGWARNDKSQLVFWVPSDMVGIFPTSPGSLGIGSQGTLRIDYGQCLFVGGEWDRCYVDAE